MAEREYYDYDDWMRAGGDPTYGQGVSDTQDIYGAPPQAAAASGPPWTLNNPPPPGSAPPGTSWMLNPGTGQFDAIPNGTMPPWGARVDQPGTPGPKSDPTPTNTTVGGGDYTPPGGYTTRGGGFDFGFGGGAPGYSMPGYVDPGQFDPGPAFSYKDFTAPTGESITQDPSFQFRMDQGRKALESSAAGKGILRSGDTMKDLLAYGQNFASQEYGNIYNRALQEYDTNRKTNWDSWNSGYQGRRDAYSFGADRAQGLNSFNLSNARNDFDARFGRWSKEGDWLTTLANGDFE